MAIIWQRKTQGVCYQVRSAGNSLRLYTDGVFHSQYNPRQLITGHVWDLLMLPAFFNVQQKVRRVLLMGVGGGAVIHQLRHFVRPDEIVAIELNPVHISVGKRFFGLKAKGLQLIEADAIEWLKNYRGEKFDLIIDDLFAEKDGEPVAVIDANRSWFSCMLKQLNSDGLIVRNFISRQALRESAALKNPTISSRFASVFQLNSFYNENFVGAFLRKPATSAALRNNLRNTPGLNPDIKSSKLRYRIQRLK